MASKTCYRPGCDVCGSALALSFNIVAGFVGGTTPLIAAYPASVIGSPPAIYSAWPA